MWSQPSERNGKVRKTMDVVGPRQKRRRLNLAYNQFVNDAKMEEVNIVGGQSGYTQVGTAGIQVPLTKFQANNLNIDSLLTSTLSTNPLFNLGSSLNITNFSNEEPNSDDEMEYVISSDSDDCGSDLEEEFDDDSFDWPLSDENAENGDDDDVSPDTEEFQNDVKQSLVQWVVECNIPRCHVNNLLKSLHNDAKLTFLPIDSRTLLSSRRGKIQLIDMPPGKYQHFDIAAALLNILSAMAEHGKELPDVLYILINIDGIPLSKSSLSDFWPILIKVLGWDEIVVGGIYHGAKKPADINQYLARFRDDILRLRATGLEFRGKKVEVVLTAICCDTPATTFVMSIATHNAYYGCRKCTTRGTWVGNIITSSSQAKTAGRVTYSELDAPLRTDESFRTRAQLKHHNKDGKKSIMEELLQDVIGDVVLDYMHLVCIGFRKKELKEWVFGKFDHLRFSVQTSREISAFLIGIGVYIPSDFPRTPRSLLELPRWKATEMRLDLLYICPVAYKPHLNEERYNHMMLLHVAVKILVNRDMCQIYAPYAESLLRLYVTNSGKLYCAKFVTFNVHSLIHLANDVRKHGCLDDFSSFPFENKLQKMKNLLRRSGRPLQQIVRRLEEIDNANRKKGEILVGYSSSNIAGQYKLDDIHYTGPILPQFAGAEQYKVLRFKKYVLLTSLGNNCVFLDNENDVFVIDNFIKHHERVHVIGRRFMKKEICIPIPYHLLL
ncbi:uncharacterized protein LOC116927889 [Daphnia magna]|uniref:uncharacterized protein LOC116927889 n=1 Tax=Daphnia magna TaxID=35525 RepID=UPI001E1BC0C4|nr:uncharacterized protein LOC116927889 [Daphnia magna]XP_045031886.1 uncharacterized protein LOC116927889 [Daphnia magna]